MHLITDCKSLLATFIVKALPKPQHKRLAVDLADLPSHHDGCGPCAMGVDP